MSDVYFRKPEYSDLWLIYDWANDPSTRKMSFHTDEISPEEHQLWFEKNLNSKDQHMFIADVKGYASSVGLMRISQDGVIGISVAAEFRGLGLGSKLIINFLKFIKNNPLLVSSNQITAFIKQENQASIRSFEKAGFKMKALQPYKGVDCFRYEVNLEL